MHVTVKLYNYVQYNLYITVINFMYNLCYKIFRYMYMLFIYSNVIGLHTRHPIGPFLYACFKDYVHLITRFNFGNGTAPILLITNNPYAFLQHQLHAWFVSNTSENAKCPKNVYDGLEMHITYKCKCD